MTRLKNRGIHLLIGAGLFLILLVGQNAFAKTGSLEFHEAASDVIVNSLQTQPKNSFLKKLYTQLFFIPVWVDKGSVSFFTYELFTQIEEDRTLSHTSRLYQDMLRLKQKAIRVYGDRGTLAQKIDLEFRISQLYKGYADYTLYGSINWGAFKARLFNLKAEDVNAGWDTYRPRVSPLSLIEDAVINGSLADAFKRAVPKEYHYASLEKELVRYLQIQQSGGWVPLHLKGLLKLGKPYEVVPLLRERLRATGDYLPCSGNEVGLVYDECLKKAVIHFQKRNGLVSNGVIGENTRTALNQTIEQRILTIRLNLDRIKWLNERHSKRHIIVNIPAFTLYFEEDGKLRLSMKVITGKRKHPTPVFSNMVQFIILNPYWNVPKSIIQKEMIPKLLRNPNAMVKKRIEIHTGWGKDARKIDGGSVDWGQYRYSKHMPFRFAQVPGYKNALGKVKFLFPNKYSVYMHDTPTKYLFKRNARAYSHGCIRLEKPIELLKTFASFNDTVDFEKAEKILKGKKRTYLNLKERVPLDVVYLTAWVDYDGVLQFRNDAYGYDEMQLSSFRKW
ncbi:MAG: hypothetical protein P794_01675 [Epsilonproteobacteria bacterium (ex Lamellibrachia satsuma)]|nr:MAG: hypothetical protein P794_01675 [Epsilonproteobacteria bacterium (ex Lamellibrachia satsuma)]